MGIVYKWCGVNRQASSVWGMWPFSSFGNSEFLNRKGKAPEIKDLAGTATFTGMHATHMYCVHNLSPSYLLKPFSSSLLEFSPSLCLFFLFLSPSTYPCPFLSLFLSLSLPLPRALFCLSLSLLPSPSSFLSLLLLWCVEDEISAAKSELAASGINVACFGKIKGVLSIEVGQVP